MNRHEIRTSATDSVKGLPSTHKVDVNLKQTTKAIPFPNVSSTLSQRSVYEEERQAGNKFRLILTVVPYCSNVLFNALTEIVKNEGSNETIVVTDKTNRKDIKDPKYTINIDKVIGLNNPDRIQMISNTEYSSKEHGGYEYHPGYDFFDNHLLRNTSFKVVNPLKEKPTEQEKEVFNTLSDYLRDRNGNYKKVSKRQSLESIKTQEFKYEKHLYLHDDILSIDESINQNLYEDNGWWGFTNNTTIDPQKIEDRKWNSMDIGKALNNHKACEFIDMYPDRSLYSFAPKYNKYTHENENNWNVVLTYPYKNIYEHPICLGGSSYIKRSINSFGDYVDETISEGNRWMGLKIVTAQLGPGRIGGNSIIFRTYTKHGLKQGDMFYLYYTNPYNDKYCGDDRHELKTYGECDKFGENTLNGTEVYYESEIYHKVTNVGDMSRNNDEYYFYTSDVSLLKEIYKSFVVFVAKTIKDKPTASYEELCKLIPFYDLMYDKKGKPIDDQKDIYDENHVLKTELLNKLLRYTNFRVRRCVNGIKSTYYIRQFRQIPNLNGAQREMTEEETTHKAKFNGKFDAYVKENAMDSVNFNYQKTFSNETYQLGFASSIYNDNVAQITFTDGINVKGLTDNLGRPLSEIYYTFVKNNAGHEVWYNKDKPLYSNKKLKDLYQTEQEGFKNTYGVDYNGYKIEFSHCFGKVTSGFEMYIGALDTEETTAPISYWKKLSSVHHITNVVNEFSNRDAKISKDRDSLNLDDDIKWRNTYFNGDLVEYNPVDFKEKLISRVMHRFNTAQRETIENEHYSQYQYHEIFQDDYDKIRTVGDKQILFEVKEYTAVYGIKNKFEDTKLTVDYGTITRPEGYYYQAHYPIKIREYTRVLQGSHYSLRIRRVKPIQEDGILIQVTTLIAHGLNVNDIIFICDDESDKRYVTRCVRVIDQINFLMSPNYEEYIENATDFEDKEVISNINYDLNNKNHYKEKFSWLQLCDILNGKFGDDITYPSLILRRKNSDIPDYATYIGGNRYLWRDLVNIGDSRSRELNDFIFANGHFYVTQSINFYLKRQDPFSTNGLYFDGDDRYPAFPNDPAGIKQPENNYLTKDTTVPC